ncbi:hypothetical protein ACVTMO_16730 [Pseudomonas segetis]
MDSYQAPSNEPLKAGDMVLIVGARGRPDLIGLQAEVLEVLIDNSTNILFRGISYTGDCDMSLSAFIQDLDGEIWFFDQRRLMKLRGQLAVAELLEVAHG